MLVIFASRYWVGPCHIISANNKLEAAGSRSSRFLRNYGVQMTRLQMENMLRREEKALPPVIKEPTSKKERKLREHKRRLSSQLCRSGMTRVKEAECRDEIKKGGQNIARRANQLKKCHP